MIDHKVRLPRVLIVDDSRIVRVTLIKHIRGLYDFREEVDGEAAWAALCVDTDIDAVLTDLSMPRLDGYGLIERIRASTDPRIARMPVVLISGEEDEASRQHAKNLGATDFITKGIGTAELRSRLDSLVNLAKAQTELSDSREQMVRDAVTGLYSASYIEEHAIKSYAFAVRHQQAATVLVIGIDNIEGITQQYGEPVAQQLLQRFGQMLAGKVRKDDSLGHFSGNAYVSLSPATPSEGAFVFAERLREAVESSNVALGGRRLPITVSIGFSTVPIDALSDSAAWLVLAGRRMQQARQAGGNRIVGLDNLSRALPRIPTIENALSMLRAGRQAELKEHVGELTLSILPILKLANDELNLCLSMPEIEKLLQEQARKK